MKIAILQCDSVLDKFQQDFGNYPQMIIDLLTNVEGKLEIEVFDVQQGKYPENIDDWDLFITTGSKAGVNDNEVWIKDLIEFTQRLDTLQKRLVGICFGHQIIALARGGSVAKSSKGWGIGVASNRVLTQPSWMAMRPDQLNLIVSHQDQISRLPKGATVIAESNFCPYFMVQWDDHFLSVQGHPEWSRPYSKALINDRRNIISGERIEEGLASLEKTPDSHQFAQWILMFAKRKI
jgi:GMP synthase-like glutamine amidotransferase